MSKRKRKKNIVKKAASSSMVVLALTLSTISPSVGMVPHAVAASPISPVFDGNPAHMKAFVDDILKHMNFDDLAYYAMQKTATGSRITMDGKGYILPAGAAGGSDNVHGVSTDFPVGVSLGQTWDKSLLNKVGTVMGDEKRGEVDLTNPNPLMFSAVSDVRINPLSGRYEEGFSEDPFLTGELANSMSRGIVGNDPFYLKVQLGTKHYQSYNAEWNRQSGDNYVGTRALNEYQLPGFLKAIASGAVQGVMTSYTQSNGVPNAISPTIKTAQKVAPFSMFNVSDFNGDGLVVTGYGNGYDKTYVPDNDHLAALMIKAGSFSNNPSASGAAGSPNEANYKNAVLNHLYGVTEDDLREHVRPQVELWVRVGYFNAKDKNGLLKGYPYNDLTVNKVDYNSSNSQKEALDAAHEGLVLLKNNNNLLPLKKNANVAVMGSLADARLKDMYGSATPSLPETNLTPLAAIQNEIGSSHVSYDNGSKVVAWQSEKNGEFISGGEGGGSQLTADYTPAADNPGANAYKLSNGTYLTKDQAFQILDWGNDAYSFKSLANDKWVNGNGNSAASNAAIQNDGKANIADATGAGFTEAFTNTPSVYSYEDNNGNKSIRAGALNSSFGDGFQTSMLKNGYYFSVGNDGKVAANTDVATFKQNPNSPDLGFKEVTLEQPGQNAEVLKNQDNYAIVVVGTGPRIVSGEGTDRARLELGADQKQLVRNVAKQFPGRTIVVVKSNYPVAMDDIQNDPNVGSILYYPYGGEYDGKALADALFGDYAPAGRLTGTWLKNTDSLPKLSPDVQAAVDPRYTVDMTKADPIQSKLTYLYSDTKPTYSFGYGLTYTSFKYSDLTVKPSVKADHTFNVSLKVTNTGNRTSDEVVQLYVHSKDSAYGSDVAKKQLAAFQRVHDIAPGATVKVTMTVNPKDFAVWDVNKQDYTVEPGEYEVMAGRSSDNILLKDEIQVAGTVISSLDLQSQSQNVWEHTFDSKGVIGSEVSKARTAEYQGQYFAVTSTQNGDYVGIPKVKLGEAKQIQLLAASTNSSSTIEIHADSPTGEILGSLTFGATSPETYDIGEGKTATELGYEKVTGNIKQISGEHNIYLVFKDHDIRVDSVQLLKK